MSTVSGWSSPGTGEAKDGRADPALAGAVEALDSLVRAARPVPFTDQVRVNRKKTLGLLERIAHADLRGIRDSAAFSSALTELRPLIGQAPELPLTPDVRLDRTRLEAEFERLREAVPVERVSGKGGTGDGGKGWRRWALSGFLLAGFLLARLTAPAEGAEIERVLTEAASSTDPAVCHELYTPAYLEQTFGVPHERALYLCEQDASLEEAVPDRVEVDEVSVRGASATATVHHEGGDVDGVSFRVRLVADGESWRVDRKLHVAMHRPRFESAYARFRSAVPPAPSRAALACESRKLARLREARLREALLDGKTGSRIFGSLVVGCDRVGTVGGFVDHVGGAGGYPRSVARCAGRRLDELSDGELVRRLFGDPLAVQLDLIRCDRDAVLGTYRGSLVAGGASEGLADCMRGFWASLSDRELARALLSPATGAAVRQECSGAVRG